MKNRILDKMYKIAYKYFDIEPEELYYETNQDENKNNFLNLDKEKINNKYEPVISSLIDDLNEMESVISALKDELMNIDIEAFDDEDSNLVRLSKELGKKWSKHAHKFDEFKNIASKDAWVLSTKNYFLEHKD